MSTTENMRFFFKGVEVDERTRAYIEKRLGGLDKYLDKILKSEIEISLDKKGKFRVEIMVHTARNMFIADDTTDSIEASTDLVVGELQTQITNFKDRLRTLRKKGAMSIKEKTVIDDGAQI